MSIVIKALKYIVVLAAVGLFSVFQMILSLCPPLFRTFHNKIRKYTPMGITDYDADDYAWSYAKLSTLFYVPARECTLKYFTT